MGPRGAGRRLNDQERMEILEIIQREAKVKNVDLAKRYGVSEGAIRKLKQMQDTVRNRYYMGNEHNRDKRKRGGFQRNAPFEEELYQWIVRMRESQPYQLMPLTQTAVRQQAIVLAKNYDKMANFKASPGWFARFCSRHRLDPIVTNGDAAAAAAAASAQVAGDSSGTLAADGVSPGMAASAAVVPSTTTADDSVYLLEALTESSPVTTSQTMEMESAATAVVLGGASDAEQGSKTGTPSINEQVQQAAREHNEAALRAAVAKIGEAQVSVEIIKSKEEEEEEKVDVKIEVEDETEEEGGTEGSKDSDEMFSLGL